MIGLKFWYPLKKIVNQIANIQIARSDFTNYLNDLLMFLSYQKINSN